MRDAEALVRQRRGRHAYLPGGLRTVDRGDALFGEQPAPGTVGDDHQFCDQLVERAAAFALSDRHATTGRLGGVAVNGEGVVVDALHGRWFAAPASQAQASCQSSFSSSRKRNSGRPVASVSSLNSGSISWWRRLAATGTVSSRDSWLTISSSGVTVR